MKSAASILLMTVAVVAAQSPEETPASCALMLCRENSLCRDILNHTSGIVSSRCLDTQSIPTTGHEGVCTRWQPLLIDSPSGKIDEIICDGGDVSTCPEGYNCNVNSDAPYAVCCKVEEELPIEKAGECPAPSTESGAAGVCANLCSHDGNCQDADKCCRNECGATVCMSPVKVVPEVRSTCAATTCLEGNMCREVYDLDSKVVSGQCLTSATNTGHEGFCTFGQPLLVNSSKDGLQEAFCGRGSPPEICPPGWACKVEDGDRYAICCQYEYKAGECPAPSTASGTVGICANMCDYDGNCQDADKCCPNECGGNVCMSPVKVVPETRSTCAATSCLEGNMCREIYDLDSKVVSGQCLTSATNTGHEGFCTAGQPLLVNSSKDGLQEAFCGRGSSPEICPPGWACKVEDGDRYAICCQYEYKAGECPAPSTASGAAGVCANLCSHDGNCQDADKCCRNECGATVCMSPMEVVPEVRSTCAATSCLEGNMCREIYDLDSKVVSGQCLTSATNTGHEELCTSGQPLLVNSSTRGLQEAFCGMGSSSEICPSGWSCKIAPNDAYAICCQYEPPVEKAGECPAPSVAAGNSAILCFSDEHCEGVKKCCSNDCGGSACMFPADAVPVAACAATSCVTDTTCREVYDRDTGAVSAQCLTSEPDTGTEKICTSGQPLLVRSSTGGLTGVFCGRGPNRVDCPSGYRCIIERGDAYAVCCQDVDEPPLEKAGECPLSNDTMGLCAITCCRDDECEGSNKCCRNNCGGKVCSPPIPSCDITKCAEGQVCKMKEVQCIRAPCYNIPTCVDIVKKGECPASSSNNSMVGICAMMCSSDPDCDDDKKCCKNQCGGTVCQSPVLATCDTTVCAANQRCEMVQSPCRPGAYCDQVPRCVDKERQGVCPAPRFRFLQLFRLCHKDCRVDADCPGYSKCCRDFIGCGTTCENPEPSYTCAHVDCWDGQICQMQKVNCFTTPCFDVPHCVDLDTACYPECTAGYKCQLRYRPLLGTQEPACLPDPENPVCSPTCPSGYQCQLTTPLWCFFFCQKQPRCVRTPTVS